MKIKQTIPKFIPLGSRMKIKEKLKPVQYCKKTNKILEVIICLGILLLLAYFLF